MDRSGKKKRPKQDKPRPFDLNQLIDHLSIDRWDAIMIGDGSGSTFAKGCGWGTLVFLRNVSEPKFFCGAYSHGTNNVAEIMAYFQPMLWYANQVKNQGEERNIHIVTDSEYTSTMGNNPGSRRHHQALWAGFDAYRRRGLFLHWHWLKSGRCLYNMEADALSRESRVTMEEFFEQYVEPLQDEYSPLKKRNKK